MSGNNDGGQTEQSYAEWTAARRKLLRRKS